MLIGIDPILGPDLLAILRAMGHGDEIAIVDANFPAGAKARRLVRCDGHRLIKLLDAILSVLPLDDFDDAVFTMQVVGDPAARPEAVQDIETAVRRADHEGQITAIGRFDFYDRVERCFAVVATGETRLYGNVILRKGIIRP